MTALQARPLEGARLEEHVSDYTGDLLDAVHHKSNGKVAECDIDGSVALANCIGIVVASSNFLGERSATSTNRITRFIPNDAVTVCVSGRVSGFSGLTIGALYYTDADGGITATPTTDSGDHYILVGRATAADVLFVDIGRNGVTTVA